MNSWTGMGRIAGDIKVSENGKTATASLAVDRPYPFGTKKDGGTQREW